MHSLWKGSFTLVANYYVEDITGRIDWMLEFSENNADSSPIVQFGAFHGHLSDSACDVKFILIKFLFHHMIHHEGGLYYKFTSFPSADIKLHYIRITGFI